ncbi:hypothetical protein [Bifidobacterium aerophilum]|uniref:LysM peptidoglycan-binding domain-containing protein n=1 Tax=Bifidobacterium aerophilum TaxID=1798155 RepID=A0A6N9Z4N3_9BIFI|nr:hypothetical protein [Bifidobacterium aerophilum]NEG89123.1 hypothetical protein [Bifidobacterium aerophilum]
MVAKHASGIRKRESHRPVHKIMTAGLSAIIAAGLLSSTAVAFGATANPDGSITVESGDTLSQIAEQFGGDWHDYTGYRSGDPNLIFPGEHVRDSKKATTECKVTIDWAAEAQRTYNGDYGVDPVRHDTLAGRYGAEAADKVQDLVNLMVAGSWAPGQPLPAGYESNECLVSQTTDGDDSGANTANPSSTQPDTATQQHHATKVWIVDRNGHFEPVFRDVLVHHQAVTQTRDHAAVTRTERVKVRDAWDEQVEHPAEYRTVHHPAQTHVEKVLVSPEHTVHHEAEYKDKVVVDKPAWDEKVETKPAWTETVHHPAEYEDKVVVDKPAWEEKVETKPAWDEKVVDVPAHEVEHEAVTHTEQKLVKEAYDEKVPAKYEEKTITDKPAWTEKVETKPAWSEKVLVKAAYDEKVPAKYEERTITDKPAWTEKVETKPAWSEKVLVKAAYDETIPATYRTVNHPAEYRTITVPAVTHTVHHEAVYKTTVVYIVGDGAEFPNAELADQHATSNALKGLPCNVRSETRTVMVTPAYDEQVIDTPATTKQEIVKPAWEEKVLVSPEHKVHHEAVYKTVDHPAEYKTIDHPAETHTEKVLVSPEHTVHHEAEYKTVEHPAEYKTIEHEAKTHTEKVLVSPEHTVHHEAEYKTITVVDKPAWTEHVETTYKTIHHEAEYKTVKHPEITHKEQVLVKAEYDEKIEHPAEYKTVHHDAVTHVERVKVRDAYDETVPAKYEEKTVTDREAWDEQVLVKDAWVQTVHHAAEYVDRTVVVKPAWRETVVVRPAWSETVRRESGRRWVEPTGHWEWR